jgi:hypothetical protein
MDKLYALNVAAQTKILGHASIHIGRLRVLPGVRVPIDDVTLAQHRAEIETLISMGVLEIREESSGRVVDPYGGKPVPDPEPEPSPEPELDGEPELILVDDEGEPPSSVTELLTAARHSRRKGSR